MIVGTVATAAGAGCGCDEAAETAHNSAAVHIAWLGVVMTFAFIVMFLIAGCSVAGCSNANS
jgi:hypothetical protein